MGEGKERRELDAVAQGVARIESFLARASGAPRANVPASGAFVAGQYPRRDGNSYGIPPDAET